MTRHTGKQRSPLLERFLKWDSARIQRAEARRGPVGHAIHDVWVAIVFIVAAPITATLSALFSIFPRRGR